MANIGAGQQTPNSSTDDFNAVAFQVRQMVAELSTMKLVRVVAVNVENPGAVGPAGTVDVLPLVMQVDGDGNTSPHGTVYGIPFGRTAAGPNGIVCDPVVGDIGYVSVADRDISAVKKTRAPAPPGSARKMSLADGVYVGAVLPQTPTIYLAFVKINGVDGIELSPDGGVTVLRMTPGKIEIAADLIVTHARVKNAWDVNGIGFVYQSTPNQIDTYTDGVPSAHHVPTPPEVPT